MAAVLKERGESASAEHCSAGAFYSNDTAGKIQAGVDSFRRAEGRPAEVVFAALRKKHGL